MAAAPPQTGRRKFNFGKTVLALFMIILGLAAVYLFIVRAFGYEHAQSADGTILAEVVEVHGRKYLRLYVEDSELNTVAIPSHPSVYFQKGGKRWWAYSGTPIDPEMRERPASYGLNNIISLTPESSLLLKISDSTPGDIVIEVADNYDRSLREEAKNSLVWLWSRTITIKY
jgi:hypothetical protein